MEQTILKATDLAKSFNRRSIFSGIDITLSTGQSLAITGRNGSGKSTLLKIAAGVLAPSGGTLEILVGGRAFRPAEAFSLIGFVAPYLEMYDEFTAWENLDLFRRIRGIGARDDRLTGLLERVNLLARKDDPVRTYSSGMKQRLKYAFALLHDPPVLLVDEPASNLDAEGIAIVYGIIEERKESGIAIIATNDTGELRLCDSIIDLDDRRRGSVGGGAIVP